MSAKLLVVDDAPEMLAALVEYLKRLGYVVSQATTRVEALARFEAEAPDLCIVDYALPDCTAFELIPELRKRDGKVAIIVLTGQGTIELAVQAIKLGAEHFLTKPVDLKSLGVLVERVLARLTEQRRSSAERRVEERSRVDPFVGTSAAVAQVRELASAVVHSEVPVLLRGETGTGKGVLARWLHDHGPRSEEAFVDLNCAGLSRELAETELFGHQRGSFTGASATKRGLLEIAHHGTLFLDEIGDLDPAVQPKLLKALEERTYRRVGDVQTRSADVRLITATHRDLAEMTRTGAFRNDLLFRINTVTIELPALRDRREDIVPLARCVIEHLCRQQGRPQTELTKDARSALESHGWPGNIRELRNVLERALLFARNGVLDAASVALPSVSAGGATPRLQGDDDGGQSLEDVERIHILRVLDRTSGRVEEAARILGVPRSSLYAKLKRYGLRASSS
jgi:DNA-binding NtrC family response regulator